MWVKRADRIINCSSGAIHYNLNQVHTCIFSEQSDAAHLGAKSLCFWQQFFAFGLADVANVEPIAALVLNYHLQRDLPRLERSLKLFRRVVGPG